ncbi:MAG: Maf family protein, partial [Pseudomonadota bacterium]
LASASLRRKELLAQIGIVDFAIQPAEIDETPKKNELPEAYAIRIASEKALKIASQNSGQIILAADTVVHCGRRIFDKAEDWQTARKHLEKLSGRRHRVTTAFAIIAKGKLKIKAVTTVVRFKNLSKQEIDAYIASNEWHGKAGGYAIQGKASEFIPAINGSYSNVVGLPLCEVSNALKGVGFSW